MATELFAAFPNVPSIFQHHVPSAAVEPMVRHPNIRARFGVSTLACEKIREVLGSPADGILGNYVDLSTFGERGPLPAVPKRWLVICEKKHGLRHLGKIVLLAIRAGAVLSAIGPRVKRLVENVPAKAAAFDLVFASARCALEAAAAGASVIVTDYRGVAGFWNSSNCHALLDGNLGGETFNLPAQLGTLWTAIGQYDPEEARRVSTIVREKADLEKGLSRLEATYQQVIARSNGQPA